MNTDFSKLIKDLQSNKFSNVAISEIIGCSPSYIGQLAKGNREQPGYDLGRRLVLLHQAET